MATRFEIERVEKSGSAVTLRWGNITMVFRNAGSGVRLTSKSTDAQVFDRTATFVPPSVFRDAHATARAIIADYERRAAAKTLQFQLI